MVVKDASTSAFKNALLTRIHTGNSPSITLPMQPPSPVPLSTPPLPTPKQQAAINAAASAATNAVTAAASAAATAAAVSAEKKEDELAM